MKLWLGKRNSSPEEFWKWFLANESKLRAGDPNAMVGPITKALNKVHADLAFGIRMTKESGAFQLEISADGLKSMIPEVEKLVAAAPSVPGWKIVAFRQPESLDDLTLQLGNQELALKDLTYVSSGGHQGLTDVRIFIQAPTDVPKNVLGQIGFIALDHALGEYAVMTKIGAVDFAHASLAPSDAKPIEMLTREISRE